MELTLYKCKGWELDKTIYLSVQIKGNIFITTKKNGGFQHEKQRIQKNVSSNNGRNNDNEAYDQ